MKDPNYFQHDYNARNDERILTMRSEMGNAEAYGLFWMLIESMAETKDGYLNRLAIAPLSFSFGIEKDKLEKFISRSIEIGLFFEKDGLFGSSRLVEHKEWRRSLSKQGKAGAEQRWGERDRRKTSPGDSPPNGGAMPTPMHSTIQYSTVKKDKDVSSALSKNDNREAAPDPILLTYPTAGKEKTWDLKASRVSSWKDLFPGLDVLQECRAALAWVETNSRKTASGMPRFLARWLTKSQNRGGFQKTEVKKREIVI